MAEEHTLVIIKPDAVKMGNVDAITQRYLDAGLRVCRSKTLKFTPEQAGDLYATHKGKFFFTGLVLAMTSWPCVVLELAGEDAVNKVREMNGATNPAEAHQGSIRCDYRSAGGPFNTVHGSEDRGAAAYELRVAFGDWID